MKHLGPSLRLLIFFTVLCGLIYPLAMTGLAQTLFRERANGEPLTRGGVVVGARNIAQSFEKNEYFWPRPSGVGFNPLPSGGSNLGLDSEALKKAVDERRAKLQSADPSAGEPPQDLLFASGSGLDPDISPEAADYQAPRVARARSLAVEQVRGLIISQTESRQWGFLGEPTVNVLALNLALDQLQNRRQ